MDTRKYSTAFAVTFLILVLNGSFTNGIIELFKPSKEEQSSAGTDVLPQILFAYDITMNIFVIVRGILGCNYDPSNYNDTHVLLSAEEMAEQRLSDLDVITDGIDATLEVVKESNLPGNLPSWNEDEKEQRAINLIALLITKFLAYHDALQYSFYQNWVQPTNPNVAGAGDEAACSLNKAAYSVYLISYGQLIDTDDVLYAIKVLLKSLTKYAEHSEVVERTFNEISEPMRNLEENILENFHTLVLRKDAGRRDEDIPLDIKDEPVDFLLHAFADILYAHKTLDKDFVKSEPFQEEVTASYANDIFTDLLNKATKIQNNTHPFLPLYFLQSTEHFLTYQMLTRAYLTANEHDLKFENFDQIPLKTDIKNGRIVLKQRELH